jgi:hypothetical protein
MNIVLWGKRDRSDCFGDLVAMIYLLLACTFRHLELGERTLAFWFILRSLGCLISDLALGFRLATTGFIPIYDLKRRAGIIEISTVSIIGIYLTISLIAVFLCRGGPITIDPHSLLCRYNVQQACIS